MHRVILGLVMFGGCGWLIQIEWYGQAALAGLGAVMVLIVDCTVQVVAAIRADKSWKK